MDIKASAFNVLGTVYDDTEIPSGKPGNNAAGSNSRFTLATLLAWLRTKLKSTAALSASPLTKPLEAGQWCLAIAVTNATGTTQTFNVGTTLGGSDIAPAAEVAAGQTATLPVMVYAPTGGLTLHITPISGGSLTLNYLII